jgi:hypothetical protein
VVARPTKWGNPWRAGMSRGASLPPMTSAQAVYRYKQWLTTAVSQPTGSGVNRALILKDLHQLRGRDLACWCPPSAPCHADVLLRLANQL